MRIVVSIHDLPVWTIPPAQVERLARVLSDDHVVDARESTERRAAFPNADVLFATKITADEFALSKQVRWIHSSAVGVAPLLPPSVVESPIPVTNSRGVHSDAIAEHAIALTLALRRHIHTAVQRQMTRQWAQEELHGPITPGLAETRMLVIGLGSIGSRVAALASGLGMCVTGMRRRTTEPVPPGVSQVLGSGDLRQVLGTADVVVLTLPRTEDTRTLIGPAELALMKPSALLINVARGRLVDELALVEALERKVIGGAGLDAFQQEPLPSDHPLWRAPNTLITPHTASFSGDYWAPVVDLFLENLARFKRGAPLLNVVNKQLGY